MDYPFGLYKNFFEGTNKEWKRLQNKIAWQIDILSNYPSIVVKCPHCGAINVHNIKREKLNTHKVCKLQRFNGNYIYYECPGYRLGIITD